METGIGIRIFDGIFRTGLTGFLGSRFRQEEHEAREVKMFYLKSVILSLSKDQFGFEIIF
jgi:hypothetical protein